MGLKIHTRHPHLPLKPIWDMGTPHSEPQLPSSCLDHIQGLKVGLYTPTILVGNSYLSWFYDRGAIKDPTHTGTSKGISQAINRGPIRKFLPKYANVYVTIQSHGLSAGAQTHYVTANGVRNGLHSARSLPLFTGRYAEAGYCGGAAERGGSTARASGLYADRGSWHQVRCTAGRRDEEVRD